MVFRYGIEGVQGVEYMSILDHVSSKFPMEKVKCQLHFIEFSVSSFRLGIDVIMAISEALKTVYPEKFNRSETKIWVDGQDLNVYLMSRLYLMEEAVKESIELLRQGRSKKPQVSNEKARDARLLLKRTLKVLRLE